jgi:hypothetical protein
MTATQVVEDLVDQPVMGPVAQRHGFVPVGIPTIGSGEIYYLRRSTHGDRLELYQLYADWIENAEAPLPPQASFLVAASFVDVLEVAYFRRG